MASTTYIPPEIQSLLGVVDTFLRWRNVKDKDKRSYAHYHPSEMGKCLRKAQYKRYTDMGLIDVEEKDLESQKLRLFDKGHNMHARWQRYFADIGVLKGKWKCSNPLCKEVYGKSEKQGIFCPESCKKCNATEFEYLENNVADEELNFKGHADLVLDFSSFEAEKFDGVRQAFNVANLPQNSIVIDMKTINHDQFKRLSGSPHPEYIIQLTIYIFLLDCEYGLLIYENKNNSDMAAFKVERDDDIMNAVKKQVEKMNEMVDSRLLPPPRPTSKSDYECKYCEFAPLCHKCKIWTDEHLIDKRKKFYGVLL